MMVKLMVSTMAGLVALSVGAGAEASWVTWEGDTYPEQDGWTRYTRAGGAVRTIQDGTLTLDGSESWEIVDNYYILGTPVPAPGELLEVDWRMRVSEVVGVVDPGVAIGAGERGEVVLEYSETAIFSFLEGGQIAEFTPGVFHDYSFTSADLSTYTLRIDGELAWTGSFVGPSLWDGVAWGDGSSSARSISTWDYVRFGIVPEPGSGLALGLAGLAFFCTLSPRSRSQR
jgi:hypothetical protein